MPSAEGTRDKKVDKRRKKNYILNNRQQQKIIKTKHIVTCDNNYNYNNSNNDNEKRSRTLPTRTCGGLVTFFVSAHVAGFLVGSQHDHGETTQRRSDDGE